MNSSFLDYKLSYSTQAVVFVGTSAMEGYDRVDLKVSFGVRLRFFSADSLQPRTARQLGR